MTLQESGEMYLETILILSQQGQRVRAVDIGAYRGYSKPSVSRALKLLKDQGLIAIDGKGSVTLLEEGERIARGIYERHQLLSHWLELIGVDAKTAQEDACKIEHHLSDASFEAMKRYIDRHHGA